MTFKGFFVTFHCVGGTIITDVGRCGALKKPIPIAPILVRNIMI